MSDDAASDASRAGIDYWQVSLVVVAALALVLAAVVAPAVVGPDESADASNDVDSPTDVDGDAGEGSEPTFDWVDLLEWLGWSGEPAGEPTSDEAVCVVQLDADPVPGDDVTATIFHEGEPLTDARVWFDERDVGETDARGQVSGTVPYSDELEIRIDTGEGGECQTDRELFEETDSLEETESFEDASTHAVHTHPQDGGVSADSRWAPPIEIRTTAASRTSEAMAASTAAESTESDESTNATAAYEVDGDVSITLEGVPDPGETLDLEAHVDGVPMAAADVTVDGDPVDRTNQDGEATVQVPEDGTERLEVAVARGDFAGTTALDVRLLEATVQADAIAPVPGSDGAVVAELADEAPTDATIAVDGDERGTTDADGTAPITLPLDPTATITVSAEGQTAQTTLLEAYGASIAAAMVLVGAVGAASYRTHGRRGPVHVFGLTAITFAALIVEAFYGPTGGLAVFGAGLVAGLGLAIERSSRSLSPRSRGAGTSAPREIVGRVLEWVVARTLVVVSVLESVVAGLDAVVGRLRAVGRRVTVWLRSLPRSTAGLARRLASWFESLPRWTVAGARGTISALRGRPAWLLAGIVGATLVVAAGVAVGGAVGGALAVVVCSIVAVGGFLAARSEQPGSTSRASDTTAGQAPTAPTGPTDGDELPSVRLIWRIVASTVTPQRWRTQAPTEIERRALEQGYPPEPIRDLTTLFRELEYGDRPPSREARERASEAYAALEDALEGDRVNDEATAVGDRCGGDVDATDDRVNDELETTAAETPEEGDRS